MIISGHTYTHTWVHTGNNKQSGLGFAKCVAVTGTGWNTTSPSQARHVEVDGGGQNVTGTRLHPMWK
jgi:hypothetical protein